MLKETIIWKGIAEQTIEKCQIIQEAGQCIITSEITGRISGIDLILTYQIILDENWNIKSFAVNNNSRNKPFYFGAVQYETGKWKNKTGEVLNAYEHCIDIDIFPTPFTNSLPLKRQPLNVGEEQEYVMIWIDLVEGQIRRDRQQYKRITNAIYRFTSLDTNFTADIEFTNDAIVKFYPELFELCKHQVS
jgi:uncharacterized protein